MTISNLHTLLSEYEPIFLLQAEQADLSCVKLLTSDVACEPHDILLGRVDDFIRYGIPDRLVNILCIGKHDTVKRLTENRPCNVIVIEKNVDIFLLCNLVSSWLSSSLRQESGLLEALSTTAFLHRGRLTLEYLCEMAHRLLRNPCVIANDNGDILASDFPSNMAEDSFPAQEQFLSDLSALIRTFEVSSFKNRTEILSVGDVRVIVGGISGRGNTELYMVLCESSTFADTDLSFFKVFCGWATNEFRSGKIDVSMTSSMGSKYLDYLLSDQSKDLETIEKRNKALSFHEQNNYFIMVADVSSLPYVKGSVSSLVGAIENKSRQILATIRDNYLVILISCYESDETLMLQKYYLDEHIQFLGIPFGVSVPFYSLMNVQEGFQQAHAAVTLGKEISPGKNLYYYKDFVLMHLLDKCGENTDIERFVLPQVSKLFDYDRVHKTQYAYTLYILLLSGNKQIAAANMLNIHRTTLQYRLDKIKNLINIDYYELYWASRLFLSYTILIFRKKVDPELYTFF